MRVLSLIGGGFEHAINGYLCHTSGYIPGVQYLIRYGLTMITSKLGHQPKK
jgi:hypothetical protein